MGTIKETLLKQWSSKNDKQLSDYSEGSHEKAIWVCEEEHEWEAEIRLRYKGSKCPFCSGRRAIKGKTDLSTLRPNIAKEWHPTKNGDMTPENVTAYSNRSAWWLCEEGHVWRTTISHRSEGKSCPYCMKKRANSYTENLVRTYPDIAAQWSKKNPLSPENYRPHSNKKVWWKCKEGHEWQAVINARTGILKRGCPYCAGRRVITGTNDLATLRPDVAKDWDYEKNENVTPQEVTSFSHKKVWWICEKEHSWKTAIGNRSSGKGCPYCAENLKRK